MPRLRLDFRTCLAGLFFTAAFPSAAVLADAPVPATSPAPALAVAAHPAPQIANSGFETPSVGADDYFAFKYNAEDAAWKFQPRTVNAQGFASGSGIAGNNSAWTYGSSVPEGTQAAYIEGLGQMSQTLHGFDGKTSYVVRFQAALRSGYGAQTIRVFLDGKSIGTYTLGLSETYTAFKSAVITPAAGNHTLAFAGEVLGSGNGAALIDSVTLESPK